MCERIHVSMRPTANTFRSLHSLQQRRFYTFYNAANTVGAQEHETAALWLHILGKILFFEEHVVVNTEKPPSASAEDRRRRVDLTVSTVLNNVMTLILLCEAKRADGSEYEAEAQLSQACAARCRSGGAVWGGSIVGTTCLLWKYTKKSVPSFVSVTS
jgi:hypothetical protein